MTEEQFDNYTQAQAPLSLTPSEIAEAANAQMSTENDINGPVFKFKEKEIHSLITDSGDFLFRVNDVCDCLGYTNPRKILADRVAEEDRTKRIFTDKSGRQYENNFVNEFGLYDLIAAAKHPAAKEFKHWVTHEVLPSVHIANACGPDILFKADADLLVTFVKASDFIMNSDLFKSTGRDFILRKFLSGDNASTTPDLKGKDAAVNFCKKSLDDLKHSVEYEASSQLELLFKILYDTEEKMAAVSSELKAAVACGLLNEDDVKSVKQNAEQAGRAWFENEDSDIGKDPEGDIPF